MFQWKKVFLISFFVWAKPLELSSLELMFWTLNCLIIFPFRYMYWFYNFFAWVLTMSAGLVNISPELSTRFTVLSIFPFTCVGNQLPSSSLRLDSNNLDRLVWLLGHPSPCWWSWDRSSSPVYGIELSVSTGKWEGYDLMFLMSSVLLTVPKLRLIYNE